MTKKLLPIAALALSQGLAAQETVQQDNRPNIILFLVDDMGWQDTSLPFWTEKTRFNELYETPNMERLASQGVMFTQAYASSVSSPSRCSILTGSNAARHRVTNWTLFKDEGTDKKSPVLEFPQWNVNGVSQIGNDDRAFTATSFVQLLKDSGYHTIHCGKAHFGSVNTPGENPAHFGFEVNISGHAGGGIADYLGEHNFGNTPEGQWQSPFAVPGLEKYHGKDIFATEALTQEAIKALDKAQKYEQPFFLYMAHYAIHIPIQKDARFFEKYKAKGMSDIEASYATMIEGMDKSLGDLMDWLENSGEADNTVVIFMSDNGGLAASDRTPPLHSQNAPLNSGKGSAYEGGIREPMIVKWPGVAEAGTRCDDYLIIEDFYPTILEIAGIKRYKTVQKVDGKSFVPMLKGTGTTSANRPLIWNFPNLWGSTGPGIGSSCSIRLGDWKLIYYYETGRKELFNISEDIGETSDLAKDNPKLVKKLSKILGKRLRKMDAQRPIFKATNKPCPWPDEIDYSNAFFYEKGKTFDNLSSIQGGEISLAPGFLQSRKNRQTTNTISYKLNIPAYKRGIFFSRDDRPGDHKWPNNTNRLLPWNFENINDLTSGTYAGIPSNGLPTPVGDALLLELEDGSFLFAKAVLGDNMLTRFRIHADVGVYLDATTLGSDALPNTRLPLAVVAQDDDIYSVLREAFATLRARGEYAPTRREGKDFYEAFEYLGWCTWEHYRTEIDERKILSDISLIEESEVPIRYVLVDDGHLDSEKRRLKSFVPDTVKFPNGWDRILSRRTEEKVKWMGLWYALAGYWDGLDGDFAGSYAYRHTRLPGPERESIREYYHSFVSALSGFDFLKVDNQSYSLPLYMGGEGSVRKAIDCNQLLEEEIRAQGMGLMNCMAHNIVNTDNVSYSNSTRVSIDYLKYNLPMAKSHLYQSYQNTLIFGQSVWPDHDMFHSSDEVCGEMMARSKAISGGPVYLSDHPTAFVPSRILPLCDAQGRLFRPNAPAVPMPESVFSTVIDGSSAYRVFAPVGDEAMSVICYNFGDSTVVRTGVSAEDYKLRDAFEGRNTEADSVIIYDWLTGQVAEKEMTVDLKGFSDRLFHVCPVVDGWAAIGLDGKYLSPASIKIIERSPSKLLVDVLASGTLLVWNEGVLKKIPIEKTGLVTLVKE